jgi:hypothetical protein
MVCPEKIRLQQHYDVAVRRWRQVDSHSQITPLTEELRKRALAERDAAKDRLTTPAKLQDVSCSQAHPEDSRVIRTYKYAISAENAERDPLFVGFARTIEEARRIKFNAELAGFIQAAIVDSKLNEVE